MAGGTWLDTKTGKVVQSQPEEGVQLVAPEVEASADDLARVETYKASGFEPSVVTTSKASAKK